MKRFHLGSACLVALCVLGANLPATAEKASSAALADAMREGHWAEALQLARLRIEAGDGAPSDVVAGVRCLGQLNRTARLDTFVEGVADRYAGDARMLLAAAEAYRSAPSWGHEVAGEFRRGPQRGGGAAVSVADADRVRALRLLLSALAKADDDELAGEIAMALAQALRSGNEGRRSWGLQRLTDVEGELPPPTARWGGRSDSDPPVDATGDAPLLYTAPESWEAAASDGERWRWALAEAARRAPARRREADLAYAGFLHEQFGVQTLAQRGWFQRNNDGRPSEETSALAVETLGDEETIARLATGVRRFELPEGHRFIAIYREHEQWQRLFRFYLDRNQRARAVEAGRRHLATLRNNARRKAFQDELDQLVKPWARFDTTVTQPAGEGATLRVTHRNAARLELSAKPIDIARLLDDIQNRLTKSVDNGRRSLDVEQLGWRLIREKQTRYVGDEVAGWSVDLETPADHADGHAPVATPLQEAGAYLVRVTPRSVDDGKGAESMLVVWVADTVLVRKPTAEGLLYQVLDARHGQPVADAKIDLIGYGQQPPEPGAGRPSRKLIVQRLSQPTDANGLATFDIAPDDGEQAKQWLAVATADGGRLAHLGFEGVWRSHRGDDPPRGASAFVINDRPVYRPGDTARFKAWVGRPDYRTPTESAANGGPASEFAFQEFQVEVHDARGEKVFSHRLTADAYGSIAGELPLPEGASLGVYQVNVVGFGGGSFRVEEYRKPEFEVAVDAPEEPTVLGEPFEATVTATYYAGTPVRGGTLQYKVVRTKRSDRWLPPRPWDWLYGRGYGWLGQEAPWRSDWRRWGCFGPAPFWLPRAQGPPEIVAEGEATLDDEGVFRLPIDTKLAAERHPHDDHEYQITATVTDAGRRTISGEGKVLAARKPLEVTVWLDRGFYDVGGTATAYVSVRRPDGKPVAGAGELLLLKVDPPESPSPDEENAAELVDPNETQVQSWQLATDAAGAAEMKLKASEPGRYRLVYRSEAADKPVEGGQLFTIRGPGFDGGGFRYASLELVPDKSEYEPGDTVRLLVNTDHRDASVSLFVRPVNGVYETPRVLRLEGKSTVIELPVTPNDLPNFYLEAITVADGQVHTVAKQIVVPPVTRVMKVNVAPSETTFLPGDEGSLRVRLTTAEGEPIVGQATVAVYDRSVEAIAGGPSGGDIRERFWSWKRGHWPNTRHSLSRSEGPMTAEGVPVMRPLVVFGHVVPRRGRGGFLGRGQAFLGAELKVMADAPRQESFMAMDGAPLAAARAVAAPAPEQPAVAVRKNFADTALWVAAVETDAEGFATVPMPLPESLTSWKVRAWAVGAGLRVGQGESEVVTRKDLMVRLRGTRFLVDGDEATFSGLVQNETSQAREVRVRLESDGDAITTPTTSTQTVTVPAKGEALVDWPVSASAEGEATVRVVAEALEAGAPIAALSDGMQVEMPVLVHGAERVESFSAVIGPDDRLATFELVVPEERRPEATRLEVRYAPTLVGAMLDTLPYLIEFPHGCTEQTLNRFLPAAIVRKTIEDLGVDLADLQPAEAPEGPPGRPDPVFDSEELDRLVGVGVRKLTEMQLSDGGWGWFSGLGEWSTPHTTAVVVRGLGVARRSGVDVPEDVLTRGVEWLANYRAEQLERLANLDADGKRIDPDADAKRHADNLDALVELTLTEAGRPDEGMLGRLYDDRLKLSPYSMAMVGLAAHLIVEQGDGDAKRRAAGWRDGVIRNLRQFVVEDDENQTAYLDLPGGYWWRWYGSEYEAHAYFLKLLAATEPRGELASRLVKHLLANRRHATRWNSTRDTALVVEAMADYVRASGEAAADGKVEVWLNGKRRDSVAFTATTALRFDGRFTLVGEELPAGRHTLELRKEGGGRLYAGAALTNFSLEDDLRAAGLEVRVKRRVQKLIPLGATGDDVDARGGLLAPKVERYRRVDVPNLGAVQSGDLVEVELTLTSKNDYEYLVIEDPKPAGFEPVEVRSGYTGNALGAYVEFRDEQVRFYARRLARGERSVRYRLRAETPGEFSALPTQIRAMYAPELRGNSDENRITVEEPEQ